MKNLKSEKGITLVALVITIIVLLILAGVSLRLVAGDEGILSRSETAVGKNNVASTKESIDLALANARVAYLEDKYDGTKTYTSFAKFLSEVKKASTGDLKDIQDDITNAKGTINAYTEGTDTITITFVEGTNTYTKTIVEDNVDETVPSGAKIDTTGWVETVTPAS